MKLVFGLVLALCGVAGLLLARPRNGKPASFVGTSAEVPIALVILGAFGVGIILIIAGVAEIRS